tara:strand:- start:97 stop:561 length:465 start_codon:yes stop_codon:yes gene_type:complete
MIREYKKSYSSEILYVINDAAIKYKGIIPDNCWHEPYMSEQKLVKEFNAGVCMYGYLHNNKLIGVIGIQEVKDVILIRHAYTLTSYQGKGAGSKLLKYLLKKNHNSRLLVGTWRDANGQFDFMKNLVSFFTRKNNRLYYSKNIGRYHHNKLKIQ